MPWLIQHQMLWHLWPVSQRHQIPNNPVHVSCISENRTPSLAGLTWAMAPTERQHSGLPGSATRTALVLPSLAVSQSEESRQCDDAHEALPNACVAARRRLPCKTQASAVICSGQRVTGCDLIGVKTIQSFMLRENQMVSEKQCLMGRLLVRKHGIRSDQRTVADVSIHCKDKCQSWVLT